MKRVLVGCGVVLGLGLVGVIIVSVVTFSWWQKNAPDLERFEQVQQELRDAYGDPDEYYPSLDGSLDPSRIRTYVSVRERMVVPRDSIAVPIGGFIAEIAEHEGADQSIFKGFGAGFSFAKEGIRLFADGVNYLTLRAEVLQEAEMGEGEFAYLDALALHGWLDWDPFAVVEDDPLADVGDFVDGVEEAVEHQRNLMVAQLRGARRAIQDLESPSAEETAFRARIEAAIEETRESRLVFPFEDDFPEAWAAAFEPHRRRLERTLPDTGSEILLEGVEHMLDDEGGRGFNFQVNTD